MSTSKTWEGFDYRIGRAVTWPRSQWKGLIRTAHRRKRVKTDQSLLLFERINGTDKIILEVYDRDRPPKPATPGNQQLSSGAQS